MLLLNVPYEEKDEAKSLGARWNPELKKWYVERKENYHKFKKWISRLDSFVVVCDYIYIVEGVKKCFRCGKDTRVVAFGIEDCIEFGEDTAEEGFYEDFEGIINIASSINPMPKVLEECLTEVYNYSYRYSKTVKHSYWANGCDNCDMIQGNFYLFNEVDSPFFITNPQDAHNLTIYKIPLKYDMVFDSVEIAYGSEDYLIKRFAKCEEIDTKI